MASMLEPRPDARPRYAIDIGSTVVKLARLGPNGELLSQQFHPRDFDAGIARQIARLCDDAGIDAAADEVLMCSSANGGLRVGIVCLTRHFSGAALRNQVLLAGANPLFVHDIAEATGDTRRVDLLLVGGGIDCAAAEPTAARLLDFEPDHYRFDALVYAGNRFLSERFQRRFPTAVVIDNPLGAALSNRVGSVFEKVRRAYIDDLVFKEGISQLPARLARAIRPTPEVASRGFLRATLNRSGLRVVGCCLALDIGGATTDLHYTVEVLREDSPVRPASGVSVARYVFTDLGIASSRDTLLAQLRCHPRLYGFLAVVRAAAARESYAAMRDGEYQPDTELLSYGCLYLALDRFALGRDPGLPTGDLGKVAQIVLTGGAAQALDEAMVQRVVATLLPTGGALPLVHVDRRYEIWVDGIAWADPALARHDSLASTR